MVLPLYSPEQAAKVASQPAAAVQSRQPVDADPDEHWMRHLSLPH
jgi:hypothetical protein